MALLFFAYRFTSGLWSFPNNHKMEILTMVSPLTMRKINKKFETLYNQACISAAYNFDLENEQDLLLLTGYLNDEDYQRLISMYALKMGKYNDPRNKTVKLTIFHGHRSINLRLQKENVAWISGYAWCELSDWQHDKIKRLLFKGNQPRIYRAAKFPQLNGIPVENIVLN